MDADLEILKLTFWCANSPACLQTISVLRARSYIISLKVVFSSGINHHPLVYSLCSQLTWPCQALRAPVKSPNRICCEFTAFWWPRYIHTIPFIPDMCRLKIFAQYCSSLKFFFDCVFCLQWNWSLKRRFLRHRAVSTYFQPKPVLFIHFATF